jgi:hypothetical protein
MKRNKEPLWTRAFTWAQKHVENAESYSTTVTRSKAMQAFEAGYAAAKRDAKRSEGKTAAKGNNDE